MLCEVNQLATAAARAAWPDIPAVVFKPLLDLTWGDATTDFCMQAAARLKQSPEEISRTLIEGLPASFPGRCVFEDGYLNLRLDYADLRRTPAVILPPGRNGPFTIILSPMTVSRDPLGFLRLLSLGMVQLSVLRGFGADCRLQVSEELSFSGGSEEELIEFCKGVLCALKDSRVLGSPAVRYRLEKMLNLNLGRMVFVQLYHHVLDQRDFTTLANKYKSQISLLSMDKLWIAGSDECRWFSDAQGWEPARLAALLVYLCGPQLADECDPAVASQEERSNYLWNSDATIRRIGQLAERGGGVGSATALAGLSVELRGLALRVCLSRDFFQRAGAFGEVREFIAALDDLLCRFNRYFNRPETRLACERKSLSGDEYEIIAGAYACLSDILSRWDLYGIWRSRLSARSCI